VSRSPHTGRGMSTAQPSFLAPDAVAMARPRAPNKIARRAALLARPVPQWELDDAITVVLFAGLGGACQGLEEAGCPVNVASNHDAVALAAHAALHPHTHHIKGDIFDVDPVVATGGKQVKKLWASPDCTDHSVAKGGAPRSARVRALPWQICRWAGKTMPATIFVENVREIRGWGPLIAKRDHATGRVLKLDGSVAAKGERVPLREQQLGRDKKRAGRSFRRWGAHMRGLGYIYEDRDLNCADFGVPTARRRFFAVMRRDSQPIGWPERTHAPRKDAEALGLLPWVPAADIIDWSLPLPSIFERKKPLAEATHRRIAAGLKRYVLESASPFLVPITHAGGVRVHGIDEPLRTVTTAHRGEIALVAPHITKFHAGQVGSDMTEPLPTVTSNGHSKRPGGAIPLGVVAAHLTRYHGERRPGDVRGGDTSEPLPTQTTENRFGVVGARLAPTIIGTDMTSTRASRAFPPEDPLRTITTRGGFGVVGATLVQTGYGERPARFRCRCGEEFHDAHATGAGTLAPPECPKCGSDEGIVLVSAAQDPRALDIEAPIGTLVAGGGKHAVVGATFVAEHRGGSVGQDLDQPLGTQTQVVHHAVCAAWMVQHNLGVVGHAADEPVSTLTTAGSQQQVAAAYLAKLRGTSTAVSAEAPCPTLSAGGNHIAAVAAFLVKYYGTGGQDQAADDALHTLSTKGRFGVVTVTIGGESFTVSDIGMRMLSPHEAAAAHELTLPKAITIDGVTRPLTKTESMRLVGNSVPKRMARLLAQANMADALYLPASDKMAAD
jgi:DNA (cytosine-5)-methyltransferase 1